MTTADRPVRWYRIEHRTRYRYSDAVNASYGRGYMRPRALDSQECREYTLTVAPAPTDAAEGVDVYGNSDSYFHVTEAHDELLVVGVSVVRVQRPEIDLLDAALPWELARPEACEAPDAVDFVLSSPKVLLTDEVRAYAAESFTEGRPLAEAVRDLTSRIHSDFTYEQGSTDVGTSIPEVMAERSGVCQDFAHLAVACLRSMGLPGRYVSGYLATDPPPGRERMVGVDASHAWAAVRLPAGQWLAFDPTNDQFVDERYTTVAWGRDYADVPPLRGVIYSDAESSTMDVSVDVAPIPPPLSL
ncbi:transglutaminase family protein [Nakamurella sp. YIM 132087]|uniref:Transglutaminase family protein n=1 Tax=Nakamurella alba TaxID=2665158 RepID=A0A7K1FQA2_9ACTN|nr:transglutaminase family protein [Nakamurella alba]MTD16250.1 transglutaminase family protein [Nakamurella alba]